MSTLTITRTGLLFGAPYTFDGVPQEYGMGDGFGRCKRELTDFLESFYTTSTRWRCIVDIILMSATIMVGGLIRHPERAYDIMAYVESLLLGFIMKHVFNEIDARKGLKRFLQELPEKLTILESAESHLTLSYRAPQSVWGSHSILVARRGTKVSV